MDTLKKLNPLGGAQNNQGSGQEPVSGEQGKGTAERPYDVGNREDDPELSGKAAQNNTVSQAKEDSGQEPISGQQGEGTATQPFDEGNREDDPELGGKAPRSTTSGDITPIANASHPSQTPKQSSDDQRDPAFDTTIGTANESIESTPELAKKPTIRSSRWLAAVNPFVGSSDPAEESIAQPLESEVGKEMDMKIESQRSPKAASSLPTNHVVDDAPPGQITAVYEPVMEPSFYASSSLQNHLVDDVAPGQTDVFDRSKGKGKGKAALVEDPDYREAVGVTESSSAASNRSERIRPESLFTDYTYPTAGTDASTIASSSRRSSTVVNIPHSKGMPITAGGVPLGFRAMQDRERRFSSMPIYEQPEQDYAPYSNKTSRPTLPQTQEEPEPLTKAPPSSTPQGSKRYDSVGVGEHAKKAPYTDSRRKSSVMQKAKNFGRKVRHSISS